MDRRIKIVAGALVVLFAALFLQLNNLQVREASALKASPYTIPANLDVWHAPRGAIVSSDGTELAYSKKTPHGYERRYSDGPLFADVTGYYDVTGFAAPLGLEASYNDKLLVHQPVAHNLHEVLTEHSGTDTIETTINAHLQQVAANALAGRTGAVVAIDPRSGAVLAMYSNPTYDPNKLSSYDAKAVSHYYDQLSSLAGASPLVNGATKQTYPPGSTFKVITTAAIFDSRATSIAAKVWPYVSETPIKGTNKPLHNYAYESCGGDLAEILAQSCDTAYALIGQQLGAASLAREANAFGFNQAPPIDLPAGEVSAANFPSVHSFDANLPFVAYSAIGQGNVTESVLQDALVAAAIGDGGVIMTPHLLAKVVDDSGHVLERYNARPWLQATSAATAAQVRTLMLGVAENGTAQGLFPANLHVAAKTGTAERGPTGCSTNWLIATGPAGPSDTPAIAVAAVLPDQAGLSCSETGAQAAGPVVAAVLEAAIAAGK